MHVNTVEAKNKFNELINKAAHSKEPIFVEKRGEPVAVILDYQTYKSHSVTPRKSTKSPLSMELRALHKRLRAKYPKGTGESSEILKNIRSGRLEP